MLRDEVCDVCDRQTFGGSHYHCGNCGGESGMYGHYVKVANFQGFLCGPPKRRIERKNGKSYAVEVADA